MDALKDACRASGDYSITLIPYYAQVIADFDTADTVRQRRFESLQKLHGQLHLYKERGYDAELLCSLAARKAELIMKASTKAEIAQLDKPKPPHYDGVKFYPNPYLTPEEELICWCETSLLAPLDNTAVQRYSVPSPSVDRGIQVSELLRIHQTELPVLKKKTHCVNPAMLCGTIDPAMRLLLQICSYA